MIIKGKDLSTSIKEALKVRVEVLKNQYGRTPNLVVVLVGEDPGSVSYVTGKAKAATEVGIANNTIRLADTITEADLLALVDQLNNDDSVDGILVQLPLPKHIDENKIIAAISPEKDVDAFHPMNVAKLWLKQPCVLPCTPKGIIKLLHFAGVDIAGKEAVVVGRSNIVGQPVAKLLFQLSCIYHIQTRHRALKSQTHIYHRFLLNAFNIDGLNYSTFSTYIYLIDICLCRYYNLIELCLIFS
nr:bifunctional 5,10-methylenetetrahydrofolate dehydrogenase/5,10-methenyltetrahydrofolate cyclohydrolase [Alistipes sp.]